GARDRPGDPRGTAGRGDGVTGRAAGPASGGAVPGPGGGAVGGDAPPRPLDARLAIAAGTCWCVTALGVWCGATAARGSAAAAASGACLLTVRRRTARSGATVGTACAILLVAAGFAVATGLRVHAADTNPIRGLYGRSVHAVMRLDGDPRRLGGSGADAHADGAGTRVLLHGCLDSVRWGWRDRWGSGRVVGVAP